jgi:hypothetical protein
MQRIMGTKARVSCEREGGMMRQRNCFHPREGTRKSWARKIRINRIFPLSVICVSLKVQLLLKTAV